MRDDYVSHCLTLCSSQGDTNASGINGNAIVNEKTGQALLEGCVPLTIKGAM